MRVLDVRHNMAPEVRAMWGMMAVVDDLTPWGHKGEGLYNIREYSVRKLLGPNRMKKSSIK